MARLSFGGTSYTVDHAVKGPDYIHGYSADGTLIIAFDGVSDFSGFSYDGEFMNPEMCEAEGCNEAILVNGKLKTKDGRKVTAEHVGAAPVEMGVFNASGSVISVDNSGDAPIHSLKIYGKTTQDGTPTPENPVELVSAGASGAIKTTVAGKNLLTYPYNFESVTVYGVTVSIDEKQVINISGTSTGIVYERLKEISLPVGTYTLSHFQTTENTRVHVRKNGEGIKYIAKADKPYTFTVESNTDVYSFNIQCVSGKTFNDTVKVMLEEGATATAYEPYKGKTLTASTVHIDGTPNGLPGIPVSSDGNYTDENGQQWICDEIDFARGAYVKRVMVDAFDGSDDEAWSDRNDTLANTFSVKLSAGYPISQSKYALSNYGYSGTVAGILEVGKGVYLYANHYSGAVSSNTLYVNDAASNTLAEFKARIAEKPLTIAYILAEPIYEDISAEELAQYAALRTYKPIATVYNDANAYMKLEYYTPTSALPISGGSLGGNLSMAGNKVTNLGNPVNDGDAVALGFANKNFAPAGYGLGGAPSYINDCNTVTDTGWYKWDVQASNAPFANGIMQVICRQKNTSALQIAYMMAASGVLTVATRRINIATGVYEEWEYDNPPMVLDAKPYRTTKRFNGKPVYAIWIDFHNLPVNGKKSADVGVFGSSMKIVNYSVNIYSANSLEMNESRAVIDGDANGNVRAHSYIYWDPANGNTAVDIITDKDMSGYTAYVYVEFTKD